MGESRIPNVAFGNNPKLEEKWDIQNRGGRCEVEQAKSLTLEAIMMMMMMMTTTTTTTLLLLLL
jgi:hypothetical protein